MSGADHRPAIDHALAGIDRKPVTRWLAGHVDGLVPPVDFDLISGGRSNLTYLWGSEMRFGCPDAVRQRRSTHG
jgi:hypothetical protein